MGLEFLDVLFRLEREFGTRFDRDDLLKLRTVADLHAVVRQRIVARDAGRCVTLPAFLEVRRVALPHCRAGLESLRPSTRIADAIPLRRRGRFWRDLSEVCGPKLSTFRRPLPVRWALWAMALGWLALGFSVASINLAILPLGVMGAVAMIIAMVLITAPLQVVPPPELLTLWHATLARAGLEIATNSDAELEDVETKVRQILVDALGIEPDEVTPEARLIEDLNMG